MAFPEFQTKEVLNKVLNSGKDALNVDLSDSVTVTVDSEFPAAAALADDSGNPTTTSVGSHLLGYDSGNTNWNRVEVDDAGHLQIDVLSITAGDNNIGNVDIASIAAGDNNIGNVDIASALPAGSNTIGVVDLGSTDNAVLDAMVVDLAAMEVLLTAANVDHAANEALLTTIDSDTNDIKTDIAALEVLSTAANVDLAEIEVATEASQAALEKMLYGTALAVNISGGDHSLGATYEAFFIGVGGDISLDCATSGSNIVFKNVASGQLLPVRATVVNQTGTTATDIVALKA